MSQNPLISIFVLATVAACAGESKAPAPHDSAATASAAATAPAAGPNVVNIKATDYAFDAPDTIPAGATTIRLTDAGKELHHVQLLKIAEGKTFEDLAKEGKGEPPRWAVPVGGPNSPIPGVAAGRRQLRTHLRHSVARRKVALDEGDGAQAHGGTVGEEDGAADR
jgi:hypothetical protein